MQNKRRTSPSHQSSPKSLGLTTGTARLPNPEPNTAFSGQQTTSVPELPNPAACRRTIRIAACLAPFLDPLPTSQDPVKARADDPRAVTLEWNAKRGQKTDRDPTAGTPTLKPAHLNPLDPRIPDLPEIDPLALQRRLAEQATSRNLRQNRRMRWRVGLNTGGKTTD
jgi:hypothetical protein